MLDNPAYSNQLTQQEVLYEVKIGNTIRYGRMALLDNPDEGVPRPLLGAAQAPLAPQVWGSTVAYTYGMRVITATEILYSCILGHTNHAPPNATYWVVVPSGIVATENAQALSALTQMHNDLVQSLLTYGVFRPVPRANDVIDFTTRGPS
jgi:hypothetical protein